MEEPKLPTIADHPGGNWQNSNKRYQVTISSRGLKWQDLQAYLKLEFSGLKVSDEQVEKTLNEKYVLTLPVQLLPNQLQDIDFLRGGRAKQFLQDLREDRGLPQGEAR
ncbi:hypothetical protein QBC44DRAFT_373457 [Cladorrhinum sp. PSN332]|nr:hypothetical protein QBC44DRAFT_373457 [Cladorrhinum sp. PSN332]